MLPHHAVVYQVDNYSLSSSVLVDLRSYYEVEVFEAPALAIADVRKIITSAHNRPFEKAEKVIYIATGQIAVPAQSALLKVLEEPPTSTKFVLWLSRQVELLPTVLSRVHVFDVESDSTHEMMASFATFRRQTIPERLSTINTVYKNKDAAADRLLYQGLTQYLETSTKELSDKIMCDVVQLHTQLHGPGASKKMLWEAIALLLPVER